MVEALSFSSAIRIKSTSKPSATMSCSVEGDDEFALVTKAMTITLKTFRYSILCVNLKLRLLHNIPLL